MTLADRLQSVPKNVLFLVLFLFASIPLFLSVAAAT